MDTNDSILLRRWVSERDADAFVQVAMRHAKMVYGVALRILGNSHDAEEIAQECFETLASTTKPPTTNFSGWLYTVAANQAKKRTRSEQRRQDREERYLATLSAELPPVPDVDWSDVHRYVDEIISVLPEIYREPLVAHFFEQETHEMIAQRLGLARSSVSHRIQQGIETVRQGLKKRGIAVTLAAMGSWFDAQATTISVPSARLTEGIARIGMAGVRKTAVTGGSISLLIGGMLSTKWVAGGIVVALVVGSSLFLGIRPPQTPEPVPAPSSSVTSEKEKASPAPPVTESSNAVETAATQSATPAATPVVEDPLASLWGFWSVETIAADVPAQQEGAVEIRQEGSNIVIASSYKQHNMIGPIHGQQLQMIWNYDFDHETVLSGTYTPNAVSFQLSGKIGEKEQRQPVVYVFKRMKGTITAEQKKLRMLREEEVKAIYSALEEFQKSSTEGYPKRLEDAARFFKGDVALLTSSPEREVIYKPENQVKIPVPSSYPPLQWESEVQYADQIVAAEAHMHESGLYNYLFQPALVTVKYRNPTQRIAASSFGYVKVEVDDTQLSDVEAVEYCASCQNNLKQLGLVERMFANETRGYISGGWAMVYPEYLSDTAVLSCPCRPIGDDSYELLFPAVNTESFCLELCGKAGEQIDVTAPSLMYTVQSKVPMIIERSTHTVNGKQGRNVVFFDGHAEFVAMNDLANKVYRFVNANK